MFSATSAAYCRPSPCVSSLSYSPYVPPPLLPYDGDRAAERDRLSALCGVCRLGQIFTEQKLLQLSPCASRDDVVSKTSWWKVKRVFPCCSVKVIVTSVSCLGLLAASSH